MKAPEDSAEPAAHDLEPSAPDSERQPHITVPDGDLAKWISRILEPLRPVSAGLARSTPAVRSSLIYAEELVGKGLELHSRPYERNISVAYQGAGILPFYMLNVREPILCTKRKDQMPFMTDYRNF